MCNFVKFLFNTFVECIVICVWFQLDISANMSSSSESHSNERDSNKNSAKQTDEGENNFSYFFKIRNSVLEVII